MIVPPQPTRPPVPEFGNDSSILCFDVESNGLHGEAFAVGAVLIDAEGKLLDEFVARCPIKGAVDPWVTENVLPMLTDLKNTQRTPKALRTAFWAWFGAAKARASYVVVANAYPVEARFLIDCQNDDIEQRYWDHPFPLFDLSSMLLALGIKPLLSRALVAGELVGDQLPQRHHPRWDAWVTAQAALAALKQREHLRKTLEF